MSNINNVIVKSYKGIFPIELDYLIPCIEKIKIKFKPVTYKEVMDKNYNSKVNFYKLFKAVRYRLNSYVFKLNNRTFKRREKIGKKCIEALNNFSVNKNIETLFEDPNIETIIKEKNCDIGKNHTYIYSNGSSKLIIDDKLVHLFETNEFVRKMKFRYKDDKEEIDLGTYNIFLTKNKKKYVCMYGGNTDLVKFLYKNMKVKEIENEKIFGYNPVKDKKWYPYLTI